MNIQIKQFIQSLLGVNSLAKRLVFASFVLLLAMSCNTQKSTTDSSTAKNAAERTPRGERGQRPSIDDIFKMDANGDGKLSESEVEGPLARDFAKIDSNADGFLTRAEVENAPQPERGQRPPRNK